MRIAARPDDGLDQGMPLGLFVRREAKKEAIARTGKGSQGHAEWLGAAATIPPGRNSNDWSLSPVASAVRQRGTACGVAVAVFLTSINDA